MTVTATFTSFPSVTDPRDGTATVTGGAVDLITGIGGLLLESGTDSLLDEGGAMILLEDGT